MDLLPAIDILGGKVVRLAKGDYDQATVYGDDPVEQALLFEAAGARWIHVVDLDGARTGVPGNAEAIARIVAKTRLSCEVGGGVRTMEALERLLDAGAARVVLGTALVRDPVFAREAVRLHGGAVAAGIDARDGDAAVAGWREGAGTPAEALAALAADMGFQHLVYTDIARDGMRTGVNAPACARMAAAFGHPVIASGGVAGLEDMAVLAAVADSVEGVIVGRAIYEGSLDVSAALQLLGDIC